MVEPWVKRPHEPINQHQGRRKEDDWQRWRNHQVDRNVTVGKDHQNGVFSWKIRGTLALTLFLLFHFIDEKEENPVTKDQTEETMPCSSFRYACRPEFYSQTFGAEIIPLLTPLYGGQRHLTSCRGNKACGYRRRTVGALTLGEAVLEL